jgi:DNA primase
MEEAARLTALVMAGAAALRTGEQWRSLLYRTERFGQLGFTNTMLVWAQCPDAIQVHDYAEWKRLGRQVIRGEQGIRILGGSTRITTVFDLLQTTGEPQPVLIKRAENGTKPGPESWRTLARLVWPDAPSAEAVSSLTGPLIEAEGETVAAASLARRAAAKLIAGGPLPGLAGRVEEESVAFLIALRLGLDASPFRFPFVTSWAGADPRAPAGAVIVAEWGRINAAAALAFAASDVSVLPVTRAVTGPRLAAKDSVRDLPAAGASAGEMVRLLEEAHRFFASGVADSWVADYLARRGFGAEIQAQWGAGYAPAGWQSLTGHLRGLGYSGQLIEAAGLARWSARGTLYDVFRDRAMFPVRSVNGTVAGFTGRAVPDAGEGVPKYLNSSGSVLYRKGRMLFGLNEQRDALAAGARPVLVEGPLDAIAVSLAGCGRYAGVAPCGTALTDGQVKLLTGAVAGAGEILVAFDADNAGLKAAVRAYGLLRPYFQRPMALRFAAGEDPASVLGTQGPARLAWLLEGACPLADVVIDVTVAGYERWLDTIEGKFGALRAVAPLVADMPADLVAQQVVRVASRLELTPAEVTAAVTDAVSATRSTPRNTSRPPPARPVRRAGLRTRAAAAGAWA